MVKFFLVAFTLFLSAQTTQAQWLSVTSAELPPYNIPAQLIRDHLTGPGVEILDVQFDGVPKAVGYFTGGDSTIGLHRGLLLTTGRTVSSAGSIGADELGTDFASTDNGLLLNDTLLAALTTGQLHDLVRYRITFRASSDSIRFRYVFASEEYPEYSCSVYNDAFGFFLEGPGYSLPVNIARIPGTNLPVTINNVHPVYGIGCPAKNGQYFNNNNNTNKQPAYDGFLDVFVAEAAVQPCGIYTMTLALADVSDGAWDSGVFLEAKSFGSAEIVTASFEPGSAILPENAMADTVRLAFTALPAGLLPLTVYLGGTAQNGLDYQLIDSVATVTTTDTVLHWLVQPLPDTLHEGLETVVLTVRDTGCFIRTFTLFLADPDPEFRPVDTVLLAAGPVLLSAPSPTALSHKTWAFSNDSLLSIIPQQTMVYSRVTVFSSSGDSLPMGTFSDVSLLESVCVNIQHGWIGDLSLYLFAPNGQFVELSSKNGDSGDNYTGTCFSPGVTTPITTGLPFAPASAAPFTGTFRPEGDWTDLLGAPVNGVWKLGVIDHANGFTGQLLDWSLTFSGVQVGDFHSVWSTGDTTETLSVAEPGVYRVTVSNAVGAITKRFFVLGDCSVFVQSAATICSGEAYAFGGEWLTTPGEYTDVLAAANGCDSVVTLTLTILPVSTDSLLVVLPPGGSFDFNGQPLTEAGTYQFVLQNTSGCDSIIFLTLTLSTATGEPEWAVTLHVSPNPTIVETLVRWNTALDVHTLRVFNINGRLVLAQNTNASTAILLKTTGWSPGWYTIQLEGAGGVRARGRLLVRN